MIFGDSSLGATPLVSTNIQVILAFIIIVLAGVVVYLYKDNKQLNKDRITDQQRFEDKTMTLFDDYRKQQDLWFEKLQMAKDR